MEQILTIQQLNSKGEGISVDTAGHTILTPFVLPQDVVRVEVTPGHEATHAELLEVVEASGNRQKPPCPYFGTCGGCQLQHMSPEFYARFKKDQIIEALHQNGIHVSVDDPIILPPHLRRRINFKAQKVKGTVFLGYHQQRSHRVLDIQACPLVLPELENLMNPLREVLWHVLAPLEEVNLFLTRAENGIDLALDFKQGKVLTPEMYQKLISFGQDNGVIRMVMAEELLFQREEPFVEFSGHRVRIPSNPFLQTSKEAEVLLVKYMIQNLPKLSKRIADLFCGLGTFSVPLAAYGIVDAYEGNKKAIHYLNYSQAKNPCAHKLQGIQRDLFVYPLTPKELDSYDVVVLDPPRAGAAAQVKNLVASNVQQVIMVSCSAQSFARDARILVKGGFVPQALHLVDQFLWTPHMEMVGGFTRPSS
jgi:23S rRNA (uracil1939-C5)-methyltransferase